MSLVALIHGTNKLFHAISVAPNLKGKISVRWPIAYGATRPHKREHREGLAVLYCTKNTNEPGGQPRARVTVANRSLSLLPRRAVGRVDGGHQARSLRHSKGQTGQWRDSFLGLALALVCALSSSVASAADEIDLPPEGAFTADTTQLSRTLSDLRAKLARPAPAVAFDDDLSRARYDFWTCRRTCAPNYPERERTFSRLLFQKDLYHVLASDPSQPPLDNGIADQCTALFSQWQQEFVKRVGKKRDIEAALAPAVARALARSRGSYESYRQCRDSFEHDTRSVHYHPHEPKEFVLALLRRRYELDRISSANNLLEQRRREHGALKVDLASFLLFDTRKDKNWQVVWDPIALGCKSYDAAFCLDEMLSYEPIDPNKRLADEANITLYPLVRGVPGDESYYPALSKPAPFYPREARRNSQEGFVLVEFDVDASGAVRSPRVTQSEPKRVFDKAALEAIAKFRFLPRRNEAGEKIATSGVEHRFDFKLR